MITIHTDINGFEDAANKAINILIRRGIKSVGKDIINAIKDDDKVLSAEGSVSVISNAGIAKIDAIIPSSDGREANKILKDVAEEKIKEKIEEYNPEEFE